MYTGACIHLLEKLAIKSGQRGDHLCRDSFDVINFVLEPALAYIYVVITSNAPQSRCEVRIGSSWGPYCVATQHCSFALVFDVYSNKQLIEVCSIVRCQYTYQCSAAHSPSFKYSYQLESTYEQIITSGVVLEWLSRANDKTDSN